MASSTWWTWVWVSSGSWWWTGRPSVLQPMGSQRVGHDWGTEGQNWTEPVFLSPPWAMRLCDFYIKINSVLGCYSWGSWKAWMCCGSAWHGELQRLPATKQQKTDLNLKVFVRKLGMTNPPVHNCSTLIWANLRTLVKEKYWQRNKNPLKKHVLWSVTSLLSYVQLIHRPGGLLCGFDRAPPAPSSTWPWLWL